MASLALNIYIADTVVFTVSLACVYSQTQHIIVAINALDRRNVSAQNIAIFRPYANIRTSH
jgi:hypothetical protein